MNLKGIQEGICVKSQEGLLGLSQLRSDGSRDSQAGRLDLVSGGQRQLKGGRQARIQSDGSCDSQAGRPDRVSDGQKTLKAELNLKRSRQAQVHSDQMVLLMARQGGWTR
jgi:hypothetical protein